MWETTCGKKRKVGLNQEVGSGQGELAHPTNLESYKNNFLSLLSQVFSGPALAGSSSAQDSLYPTLFLELYLQTSPDSTVPQVPDTLVALIICQL